MNKMALIWVLSLALVGLSVILTIDFIMHYAAQKKLRRDNPLTAAPSSPFKGGFDEPTAHDSTSVNASRDCNGRGVQTVTEFDLMGMERPTLAVTLPPDAMVIHLLTPSKAMSDRFAEIGKLLERLELGTLAFEGIEQLYKFASLLLSENKEGRSFTVSEIKSRCSAGDIAAIMQMYLAWLTEVISSKN